MCAMFADQIELPKDPARADTTVDNGWTAAYSLGPTARVMSQQPYLEHLPVTFLPLMLPEDEGLAFADELEAMGRRLVLADVG